MISKSDIIGAFGVGLTVAAFVTPIGLGIVLIYSIGHWLGGDAMTPADLAALRATAETDVEALSRSGQWRVALDGHALKAANRVAVEYLILTRAQSTLALCAEIDRQRAEIDAMKLTLGEPAPAGREPFGCPVPGACVQVAEIARLREALTSLVLPAEAKTLAEMAEIMRGRRQIAADALAQPQP